MTSKITIRGHHIEITEGLREHVHTHLGRALKHFDQMQRVSVSMRVEKLVQYVEVTVHMPHKDIHCSAHASSMYTAIDEVCLKLDRVVLKHKEQVRNHQRPSNKHFDTLPLAA